MGHVKANAQVGSDGQPSGNTELEITYGGHESPFGGLDTSAPPAYIDPKCFAASEGFLIVDNKLVLTTLNSVSLPTLWTGIEAVPLKFGTYYDSVEGQLNYAIGLNVTPPLGPPLYFGYDFYITVWDSRGFIVDDSTLFIKLWQNGIQATPATITIPMVMGETTNFTDTGTVGLACSVANVPTTNVTVAYAPGDTIASRVTALAAAITAASATTLFTAAPSLDGYSLVLTAVTPGVAGNLLGVCDFSTSATPGLSPAFYFPIRNLGTINPYDYFADGADFLYITPPTVFSNISVTAVGGVLYFANLGPMILKYSVVDKLQISTMYRGVQVIKKFAGSLIGLKVIPQLSDVILDKDMIFAWSAAHNLDEWNPLRSDGNVTGAGFAQLDDVADALNGLIVSNNTAFIIRSQGISYASATGNGQEPFQFAHIGLGDQGEGAQNSALVAQYDQTGVYVGNSDIFQVSGSITPIGSKIATELFSDLSSTTGSLGVEIFPCSIADNPFPLLVILIGGNLYLYDTENKTWMMIRSTLSLITQLFLATFASIDTLQNRQTLFNGHIIYYSVDPIYQVLAYQITEGRRLTTQSETCSITFPQEELMFGRDVTIDALYIALNASFAATVVLSFLFNGVAFSSVQLDPADFPSLDAVPTELKVFPVSVATTGVFTSHSPQLTVQVTVSGGVLNALRFTKLQIYATFDPAQRPV